MPISDCCVIAETAKILYPDLVNLYGCRIDADAFVGPFVEIQKDVHIGERTRIQSHAFLCEGVTVGHDVFIGHGVIFINDRDPKTNNPAWKLEPVTVEDEVSIGSGAIIMCGITLHAGCRIGAGAVVTKDVPTGQTVVGVPAADQSQRGKCN